MDLLIPQTPAVKTLLWPGSQRPWSQPPMWLTAGARRTQSWRWPGVLWTLHLSCSAPAPLRSPGRGGALDTARLGGGGQPTAPWALSFPNSRWAPHTGRCQQTLPVNVWGALSSPSPPCGPQTLWPHSARTQSGLGSGTFWSQGTGVRLSFKRHWNAGRLPPFSLPILNLDAGVNRAWQTPDPRDPRALHREARVCKSCFSLHSNFNTNKRILFQGQRRKS